MIWERVCCSESSRVKEAGGLLQEPLINQTLDGPPMLRPGMESSGLFLCRAWPFPAITAWARRHSWVCLQTCTISGWLGSINTSLQTAECSCKSKGTTNTTGGEPGQEKAGPASSQLPGWGKGSRSLWEMCTRALLGQVDLLWVYDMLPNLLLGNDLAFQNIPTDHYYF